MLFIKVAVLKFQTISIQIKTAWNEIPKPIKKFALRGLLIFILWETIYISFLEPNRIVDKPLTEMVGNLTVWGLDKIYPNHEFYIRSLKTLIITDIEFESESIKLMMGNQKLIGIADSCNGLNLYILFFGFILAFPSSIQKKIVFGIVGILIVFSTNVLRCIGLSIIQIHYPHFMFYAHHYVFKIITYAVVFFLWSQFAKSK